MKKGYLVYLIENCLKDLEALERVSKELNKGMNLSSNADVNYLGVINRCVQECLIIKVASLFDRNSKSIALYNALDKKDVDKLRKNSIIKKIIRVRNKFIAHNDFRYLEIRNFGLVTADIITSNLKELLKEAKQKVEKLIKKGN